MELERFNPAQQEAILHQYGPLLILAGAGTGKTSVITHRIAYLLRTVAPSKIVGLTFTNKAAKEMQQRLYALAPSAKKGLFLGTFHRFCLKLLKENLSGFGLPKGFGLIGTSDQVDLVRKAIEELNWQKVFSPAKVHALISLAKNHMLDYDELASLSKMSLGEIDQDFLAQVYEVYERQLKLNRVIDFDDCIFKTAKGLEKNSELLEKIRAQFDYLIVDEFQDTNSAQLRLLELLGIKHQNVCVVGDDDQSIYSWRGADPLILQRFEQSFLNAKVVFLEQNYRCTNLILNAANELISKNINRKKKILWSASDEASPIQIIAGENELEESNLVAEKCMALMGRGYKPAEIAILYRSNKLARNLELSLRTLSLPYKTFGGQSLFERKEIKDFMAYFRLILNPHERLSFWRTINLPTRGVGLKTLERIEQQALDQSISPFDAVQAYPEILSGKASQEVPVFIQTIKKMRHNLPKTVEALKDFSQRIIDDFSLVDEIKDKNSDVNARNFKIGLLQGLPGWLCDSANYIFRDKPFDCRELVSSLTLEAPEKSDEKEPDYISLMTVHAAKGLEFKAVFVIGLEEELFPHKNSLSTKNGLDEERRLFYVAITRAKIDLFLCRAKNRKTATSSFPRMPSRFFGELGETLDQTSFEELKNNIEADRDQRKKQTIARLGDLKSMLSR